MSRNYDYTTGNLLNYLYHQNYYKLVGVDLPSQKNTSIARKRWWWKNIFLLLKSSEKLF